ncbi:MAG: UDP-N-acetylmuramoyl-tripeptide--D-alanyl-D-alanine ligase [Gemmatimonadetes bacterium]|nr:UDP-N-acetylmuramoyl-tripeptide--D-alanyl-D-alanine ligase [Gemmatimonadota bacterium]
MRYTRSNGKTSTKELIRGALSARLNVHATQGNLNNQIGVPLTLLALPDDTDVAVIEVGTNAPGEIAWLRAITEPNIAVVTAIQEEHLEGFGDLVGVLAEEASLCDGVATVIIPAAEVELLREAMARVARTGCVVSVGLGDGTVAATAHGLHEDGRGWMDVNGTRVEVPLRGAHNLRNAMLALAVAAECGVAMEDAAQGIAGIDLGSVPAMRSSVVPLGSALLINDAYNANPGSAPLLINDAYDANPGSARAAITLLADVAGTRPRVIVLGTMRELGSAAERSHREIAEAALASGAGVVAGIGDFAAALGTVPHGATTVVTAPDVDELWPLLQPLLRPNAAILLKASRGVRLERLVPYLTDWSASPGVR